MWKTKPVFHISTPPTKTKEQNRSYTNTPPGRLEHREEAEKFYRDLASQGMSVRVGMEASGQASRRRCAP
jgi:hypothetical protein